MSERPEERETDALLRQGLQSLPTPEISSDFDARIRAGLQERTPWWVTLKRTLQPMLTATACSVVVTLGVLKFCTSAPELGIRPSLRPSIDTIALERGAEKDQALERALDSGTLSSASLGRMPSTSAPSPGPTTPAPLRSPRSHDPERRSESRPVPMA